MELINKKVQLLIKKFDTSCPFKLAKSLGIHVEYEYLGDILGYYSKHFRVPIIHINENSDERQQIFICAHELGHAILHPDSNTPFLKKNTFFSVEKIELEANTFAIELLFSDKIKCEYENTSHTIQEVANIYGIPKQLALLKSLS